MQSTVTVEQALTIDQLFAQPYDLPEATVTGPVCGECSDAHTYGDTRTQVRHASIAHISFCNARLRDWAAEYASERAAELAVERFFEEGPHGPQDDPIERALWALEDARRDGW